MMTPQEIDEAAWPIVSRPLRSGAGQVLVKELRWSRQMGGKDFLVWVPTGFVWDGASIPRWAWTLIGSPFTGKYQQASLVHDHLYISKTHWEDGRWAKTSRKFADKLFYIIMLDDGVEADKAMLMWKAVRLGGGSVWGP